MFVIVLFFLFYYSLKLLVLKQIIVFEKFSNVEAQVLTFRQI